MQLLPFSGRPSTAANPEDFQYNYLDLVNTRVLDDAAEYFAGQLRARIEDEAKLDAEQLKAWAAIDSSSRCAYCGRPTKADTCPGCGAPQRVGA